MTDYARRQPVWGGLLTQWEMSATFHSEAKPIVAYCGALWARGDGDTQAAWATALPAVLPGQPAPLQAAVRALAGIPHFFPKSTPHAYLYGPSSEGESTHRTATYLALQQLLSACVGQPGGSEIVEEYQVVARQNLLHWELRALLPAIYDPRRPAADTPRLAATAAACRAELDWLSAQRAPLHERLRPGMDPADGATRSLQAVREGLAPAWERLARATTGDDWWLVLRLFLPDTHGAPRLKVTVGIGEEEMLLLQGGYKPLPLMEGSHYTLHIPFTTPVAPQHIRLEGWGYGGQGVTFLALYNPTLTRLPARIRLTEGQVNNPSALLRDDSLYCYLGRQDILSAIHTPELAEEHGVVEVEMTEGEL